MNDLVIFDLDGTLVDSPRAIVVAFQAAFASMSVPAPAGAAIRSTIGLPLEQAFGMLLDSSGPIMSKCGWGSRPIRCSSPS